MLDIINQIHLVFTIAGVFIIAMLAICGITFIIKLVLGIVKRFMS